jgi:putative flippase GtrA
VTDTAELARLARYGVVGLTNTALTLGAYALLVGLGVAAPLASAAGFAVGAANGWLLHRRWTFRGPGRPLPYLAVQAAGAAASAGGLALARGDGLAHLPAELVVAPAVTLLTYALARTVVFVPAS